jgi:hypothetical protein
MRKRSGVRYWHKADVSIQTYPRVPRLLKLTPPGQQGAPFGEVIMQNAAEGTIKETTYWWPRPGSDEAFEKTTFYTKVGDQVCGVGYYVE